MQTDAGLQKALKKTDLVVEDVDVIMEGTSSLEIISNRISIPDLIGDPDVPGALVKNPTRTAVTKGLTLDMSWKHLEKALSCGKGISGFIMGSSSSVAYVEFEVRLLYLETNLAVITILQCLRFLGRVSLVANSSWNCFLI